MSETRKTIFVIGGTGAQGIPVVEALTKDSNYSVRALTRNPNSPSAQALSALPNVIFLEGRLDSDATLRAGLQGCWGAWINIDGFAIGQKAELFWGIRTYQLAREAGVKFFVWGNLDYALRDAGYDDAVHCGHYDTKGVVGDWILSQQRWHAEHLEGVEGKEVGMQAAIFTTGPYLDMILSDFTVMTPKVAADGAIEWRVPLGDGKIPYIALDDVGFYTRWLFDNSFTDSGSPGRAAGMDLKVATAHLDHQEIAEAFTAATGVPARCTDLPWEEYVKLYPMRDMKFGMEYNSMPPEDGSLMTWAQNFRGFWELWRRSGGEEPLVKRDYGLLDEIHPGRVKGVREWFERHRAECEAVAKGRNGVVLKLHKDRMEGGKL